MNANKTKYIAPFLALVLILSACRKEKSYWDADFVAPIAHGSLTLASLFPDTIIKSNTDSTLKISFQSELINYQLDSLLKIPDTTVTTAFTFTVPLVVALSPGMNIPLLNNDPANGQTYYNLPNGIQLKKAIIKQGAIHFTMQNRVYEPLAYRYQLLSATKNNHILDTTFHIPKADSATGTLGVLNGVIDLSGYTIDFTGINHNAYNTTTEIDSVHVENSAQAGFLYPNQGFTSNFSFKGIIPKFAIGYFGNQTINVGPDTTSFDIFKTIKSGILDLNSASVNLRIINEFGATMRTNINYLSAISTNNAQTVTLNSSNSSPIITPININAAINNGMYAPVTASTKTITINSNPGNTPTLTNFIGILPDMLSYKLTAQVNPFGNQSAGNDFGYYGTAFKAYMDADIPLNFAASNLILGDTVAFNLSDVNQLKNINHGQLILTATNGYPFSINLQGYLLDENKQVIDVLFSNPNTIDAPALDVNFKVIAPLQTKLFIPLNADKITNIRKAKYIYYKSTFNTASQPNRIKFYNYYNLDLLLTADINYSIGK